MIPYDEDFHKKRTGPVLKADYKECVPKRTVGDDDDWVVWPARVDRDVCELGLTYEQSLAKHRREWREALGLPIPIAPGPLKGAFCIPCPPDASQRIWWPAFLAVDGPEQDRYIRETVKRGYNFAEIQVSGNPYHNDYPNIALDPPTLRAGLQKIKAAGLTTIVAFDDTRNDDLSYLREALAYADDQIDWCMGIYEVNGVVQNPDRVLSLLVQSHQMLPKAKQALHFTDLVNSESHGLVDFDKAKEAGLNALFFQAAAWEESLTQIDNRIQDWTRRLMGGMHGYPILSDGVFLFELSTSMTYRYIWSEQQGIDTTNTLMSMPLKPDEGIMAVKPTGWCDGGTV